MPKLLWKKIIISRDMLKQHKIKLNNLKTHKRNLNINIFLLNKVVHVYNGIHYIPLNINYSKLNYKLGYFIPTKKSSKLFNNLIDRKIKYK